MIRLYHQETGSQDVIFEERTVPAEVWQLEKRQAIRWLRDAGNEEAATVLEEVPFQLWDGTNGFGDRFDILHYSAPLGPYLQLAEKYEPGNRYVFQRIVEALRVANRYVRFITLDLAQQTGPSPVPPPSLATTSEAVERALADAEHLLRGRGASSAVDRVHTLFHGYLRAVALSVGLPAPEDANLNTLFRLLRTHPRFSTSGPRASDIERVVQSMATIVDALNPVRNRASGAHPNEDVLAEPEAMLVINSVRTLLHYISSKLQ